MIPHLVNVITMDSCPWNYVKELLSWNRDAVGAYFCDIPHAKELLAHCRVQIGYCVGYNWCWYARMFFSSTVNCCLIFFTLFFMYQCLCNDVNKLVILPMFIHNIHYFRFWCGTHKPQRKFRQQSELNQNLTQIWRTCWKKLQLWEWRT